MWGKIKTTGDDWMYPKPLMDLRFGSMPRLYHTFVLMIIVSTDIMMSG